MPSPTILSADELRRHAEAHLANAARGAPFAASDLDAQRLVHELQVHQVELEMQNQALLEAHDQLADLYNLAPIAYLTLDRKGRVTNANAMARKLIGSAFSANDRQALSRFVRKDCLPAYQHFLERLFSQGHLASCNLTIETATDHSPVYVLMEGMAEKSGQACRLVMTDLTRQHVIEDALLAREAESQELAAAKEAAEAASRAKATFLANMSHEIRTPMSAIVGMVHLMQKTDLNSEQQTQLAKIATAARNLLGILNDILDFSKIEANQLGIEETPFALAELLSELGVLVEDKITAKQLCLKIDLAPGLAGQNLIGDPLRLKQVLLNLLSNAVKFTTHGEIGIDVRIESETMDDALLSFAVRDTGCGIAPEVQDRIFSPFDQADASTTRQYGGTGLGLSISKRLVQLMGGDISLASTPGIGSIFSFAIRLKKVARQLQTELAPPVERNPEAEYRLRTFHRGKRILLVEDDEIIQEVMLAILRDEIGLHVDLAGDGVQAVAIATSTPYDLILMDIQMPNMDGLAATHAIRQLRRHETTPIVAMTANAFVEDRQHCLDAGMDDFISKPVVPENLFAILVKYLDAATQLPQGVN